MTTVKIKVDLEILNYLLATWCMRHQDIPPREQAHRLNLAFQRLVQRKATWLALREQIIQQMNNSNLT